MNVDLYLIKCIKERPVLWQKNRTEENKRAEVLNGWKEVSRLFGKPMQWLKSRWRMLCEQFYSELVGKNRSSINKKYSLTFIYFDEMLFLKNELVKSTVKPLKANSNTIVNTKRSPAKTMCSIGEIEDPIEFTITKEDIDKYEQEEAEDTDPDHMFIEFIESDTDDENNMLENNIENNYENPNNFSTIDEYDNGNNDYTEVEATEEEDNQQDNIMVDKDFDIFVEPLVSIDTDQEKYNDHIKSTLIVNNKKTVKRKIESSTEKDDGSEINQFDESGRVINESNDTELDRKPNIKYLKLELKNMDEQNEKSKRMCGTSDESEMIEILTENSNCENNCSSSNNELVHQNKAQHKVPEFDITTVKNEPNTDSNSISDTRCEDTIFAELVLAMLRQLDPEAKKLAKRQIMNILLT